MRTLTDTCPEVAQRSPKKHVRIISPHSSTSNDDLAPLSSPFPKYAIPAGDNSPPPPHSADSSAEEDSSNDPFDAGSDIGSPVERIRTPEHGIEPHSTISKSVRATTKPINPFSRPLHGSRISKESNSQIARHPVRVGEDPPNPKKAQLDVNTFTRLLLTGARNSGNENATSTPHSHLQTPHLGSVDTSSNTDASSISRQSIFERTAEAHHETPRTSHEGSPSEDVTNSWISGSPRLERSKTLAPTMSQTRIPHTVSFTDAAISTPGTPPKTFTPSKSFRPTVQRSPSDLNKPLPPRPGLETDLFGLSLASEPMSMEPTELPAKQSGREPPKPPLSRRQSQLRQRDESKRSSIIAEETTAETWPANTKQPPPPPPRRRSQKLGSEAAHIPNVSNLGNSPSSQVERTQPQVFPPRPPPTRNPSTSSNRRPQRSSPAQGASVMAPPPPPPPRNRGISQSSYETPRRSTESSDVMADLSSLQREVDELRGKFRTGTS